MAFVRLCLLARQQQKVLRRCADWMRLQYRAKHRSLALVDELTVLLRKLPSQLDELLVVQTLRLSAPPFAPVSKSMLETAI